MNFKKNCMKYFKRKKTAFSLLEIGVVFLLVGVVVGAVIGGRALIDATNSITARLSSKTSLVGVIENLALWYDATSEDAFDSTPGDGGDVSTWKNINPQVSGTGDLQLVVHVSSPVPPLYTASAINGHPAIRFTDNTYLRGDVTHAGDKFSAIYVGQRVALAPWSGSVGFYNAAIYPHDYGDNRVFFFGDEQSGGGVLQSYRNGISTGFSHPGNAAPYILTTIYDGTNNTSYLNGVASTPVASSGLFDIASIIVGARQQSTVSADGHINGYVGEVIAVKRNLTQQERKEVEKYLSNKWGIDVDHS